MNTSIKYGIFLLLTASISTVSLCAQGQANLVQAGGVIKLKSAGEFEQYLGKGKIIVVLFSSLTCGPCKSFHPIYEQIARENSDVLFLEVIYGQTSGSDNLCQTSGSDNLLNKYSIRAFPSFVFFNAQGNKINLITGANENTKNKILGEIAGLKSGTPQAQQPVASAAQVQPKVVAPAQPMPAPTPVQKQAAPVQKMPMQSQPQVPGQKPRVTLPKVSCPMTQEAPMIQPESFRKKASRKKQEARRPRQRSRVQKQLGN